MQLERVAVAVAALLAGASAIATTSGPVLAAADMCNGMTIDQAKKQGYNVITSSNASDVTENGVTYKHYVGTKGKDFMIGTSGRDFMEGLGGDDVICGKGGDDILDGGAGNNILKGGPGDNTIRTASSGDTILKGHGKYSVQKI